MAANEDRVARWVSYLSLLVAVLAVAVPYFQQKAQLQEQLVGELSPVGESYVLTDLKIGDFGQVVQSRWRLTLSNIGSQKLSLLRYVVRHVDRKGLEQYTGLDGGIVDPSGSTLSLPISLEGGETKVIELNIGTVVTRRVFSILESKSVDKRIPVMVGNLLLGREGIDLYENAVSLREFEGGAYFVEARTRIRPTYLVELTSSRGSRFQILAAQ